jgi:hypothetical protein
MRSRLIFAALVLPPALGCGSVPPRSATALRLELEASGLDEARQDAPDLAAAAYAALEEAARAELAGDREALGDHATRARLLASAALAERERAAADRERLELERRAIELEEQILADEREARAVEEEARREAAARAAREELLRALERAERGEAHPVRRRRLSIGNEAEARRAAVAIRERSRLLAAAAAAMGADAAALARVQEIAERSASTEASLEALALAAQAYDAARAALASARRARAAPTAEEIHAAEEAARSEGFRVVRLDRGLGIEVEGLFHPGSTRPLPQVAGRLRRLAALVASHPHGPVALEVDVSGAGERATSLARERGEWLRRALVEAGIAAERLTWRPPDATFLSPDPGERVRLVLVSYAPRP